MEQNRYNQNHKLFITGMISLLLCLAFLLFMLFMLPHLLFGWIYDVPETVTHVREWITTDYGVSSSRASLVIFLFLLALVLLFGFVAYYASTRVESKIFSSEEPEDKEESHLTEKLSAGLKESFRFFITLLAILIVAFAATVGFHWMISLN